MTRKMRYVSAPVRGPQGFDRLDLALGTAEPGDVGYLGIAAGRRWYSCADGPTAVALANRLNTACFGAASLHDRHEVPSELLRLRPGEAPVVGTAVTR